MPMAFATRPDYNLERVVQFLNNALRNAQKRDVHSAAD
jgi:hypothetical protein